MILTVLPKTLRDTGRFSYKFFQLFTRRQSGMGGSEVPKDPYQPQKTKDQPKSWVFTVAGLKRHYELTPIVFCLCVVLSMGTYMIFRGLTKNDVMIDRSKDLPPWERIDLDKKDINKIFVSQQKFHGLPELKKLKKEINEGSRNGNGNGVNGNGPKGKK